VLAVFQGFILAGCKSVIGYIFTSDENIVRLVSENLTVYTFLQFLDAVLCVCSGILVGCGMQKIAALSNLVFYYFIGLPVGIALMFAAQLRILGLWLGLLICVFIQTSFFLVLIFKADWKKVTHKAQRRAGKTVVVAPVRPVSTVLSEAILPDVIDSPESAQEKSETALRTEGYSRVNTQDQELKRGVVFQIAFPVPEPHAQSVANFTLNLVNFSTPTPLNALSLTTSFLSIEEQADLQFPYAMRDLPPVIHSAEKSQKQDHHEMEEALTAANGRLPGYPGTPPSSCPVSCPPASSPTVPPRPNHTGRDSSQILPLKRQLVSQVSLDSPLSPALRPRSPWGLLDPYDSPEDQDKEYVGFATLPNQVHRKTVKKGFTFTLMVAGETGLGKSTLINSLFLTDLYKDRKVLNAEERISQTVDIIKHTIGIEEKGVKLRLSIIDTPGFGDAVNNTASWKHVEDYIDQQFEQYFRDESGLNRKNIQDNRVHCLLYFISPFGHGYADDPSYFCI
ncbi:hypothetical protein AMECASPLE_009995, partial [Ameca splendens]